MIICIFLFIYADNEANIFSFQFFVQESKIYRFTIVYITNPNNGDDFDISYIIEFPVQCNHISILVITTK